MFWIFNNTKVEDNSLEVQSKEYAVKAFNKLLNERDELNNKIRPLITERDEITSRQIELCDQARVCLVLTESKIFNEKQMKKIRSIWDTYIEKHSKISDKKKKVQLEIDSLSLEKKKVVEKAQNLFRDHDLHTLNMDCPYY